MGWEWGDMLMERHSDDVTRFQLEVTRQTETSAKPISSNISHAHYGGGCMYVSPSGSPTHFRSKQRHPEFKKKKKTETTFPTPSDAP